LANVWTHGTWVVKPGSEDAFQKVWADLARSAISTFGTA